MVGVNLNGPFYFARAVLSDMMDTHWGRIVNISSGAGQNGGGPGLAHYSAAKAGILGLTKAMALELASAGITINALAPGVVDAPILKTFPTRTWKSSSKGFRSDAWAGPRTLRRRVPTSFPKGRAT